MLLKVAQLRKSGRIALLTPYDGGNLGDSAIQQAIIANLHRCDPNIQVCGITLNPARTSARHEIPCFPLTATSRLHYQGTQEQITKVDKEDPSPATEEASGGLYRRLRRMARAVPFLRWLKVLVDETLHAIRSYRWLRQVDVLVIAGGGQLDDEWGGSWGHPYALMKWSGLARACGSAVVFLSVGACRMESRLTRLFLKTALTLATYRSYRDAESRRLALGLTPCAEGPVVPDLAFSFPTALVAPDSRPEGAALRVGVSPIAYGHSKLWPTADQPQYERYIAELASFVRETLRSGASVTLFSSSPPDDQTFADLRDRANVGLDSASGGHLFTGTAGSVGELLDVLHSVNLVVASRLHGVLLSFLSGKPSIAISYDRKVSCLMEELGQAEYCVDIRSFKSDDLLKRVSVLRAHSGIVKSAVAARCRQHGHILDEQYRLVTQLVIGRYPTLLQKDSVLPSDGRLEGGTECEHLDIVRTAKSSSEKMPGATRTSN